MAESTRKTSPVLVAAAWAVVSIPLVWGIYNTGLNAAKLFTVGAPPAAAPAKAAGPAAPAAPGPPAK